MGGSLMSHSPLPRSNSSFLAKYCVEAFLSARAANFSLGRSSKGIGTHAFGYSPGWVLDRSCVNSTGAVPPMPHHAYRWEHFQGVARRCETSHPTVLHGTRLQSVCSAA